MNQAVKWSCEEITASFASMLADIHGRAFDDGWDAASITTLMEMPGAFGFLIKQAEEPVGFILARVGGGEGEIITIGVLPDVQGQGAGQRLVAHMEETAKDLGAETLFLEVAEDNAPAKATYFKAGYVEVGRRPAYYTRPGGCIDALVLNKPL